MREVMRRVMTVTGAVVGSATVGAVCGWLMRAAIVAGMR